MMVKFNPGDKAYIHPDEIKKFYNQFKDQLESYQNDLNTNFWEDDKRMIEFSKRQIQLAEKNLKLAAKFYNKKVTLKYYQSIHFKFKPYNDFNGWYVFHEFTWSNDLKYKKLKESL